MKFNINHYYLQFLIVVLTGVLCSCGNDDIGPGGVVGSSESYSVKINGSHPDGAINADIQVPHNRTINQDKVTLTANQSFLTIIINLPASETPSGKSETIGLVIQNLDATDLWNIEDTYNTFHFSLSHQQRKRAIIDYVISDTNFFYGSLNRFDKGGVTVKREGDQLVGTFVGKLQSDGRNGVVDVSGSFRANLSEDGLD